MPVISNNLFKFKYVSFVVTIFGYRVVIYNVPTNKCLAGNYNKSSMLLFTRDEVSSTDEETEARRFVEYKAYMFMDSCLCIFLRKRARTSADTAVTSEACCSCKTNIFALKDRFETLFFEISNTLADMRKEHLDTKSAMLAAITGLQQQADEIKSMISGGFVKSPSVAVTLKPPATNMAEHMEWFDSLVRLFSSQQCHIYLMLESYALLCCCHLKGACTAQALRFLP